MPASRFNPVTWPNAVTAIACACLCAMPFQAVQASPATPVSGTVSAAAPAPAAPTSVSAAATATAGGATASANAAVGEQPVSTALPAPEAGSTERNVKAAFLFRFLGYIDWPPQSFALPDSPYVIALAGNDALAHELAEISTGRLINGRPVQVRRVAEGAVLDGVHLLFISRDEALHAAWLRRAQQARVVAVTETDGALAQGSVINFLRADARVRFEISLASAERCACRLSSRLLALASVVQPGQPGQGR